MKLIWKSTLIFATAGLGLSCALIALQVDNPTERIFSRIHYQDYALFMNMGARLVEFRHLGELGALCALLYFLVWARAQMRSVVPWPLRAMQGLLLGAVGMGTAFTLWLIEAVSARHADEAIVPPFLWTHFGPLGIALGVTVTAALVGFGVGISVYGLAPLEAGFRPGQRVAVTVPLAAVVVLLALCVRQFWMVPRYQIGQDLRHLLHLTRGTVSGRTVVWLDAPRPSTWVGSVDTWSVPDNLTHVGNWMRTSPWPSAQTRPVAAVLGNAALWSWEPLQALEWLDVQRTRQPHDSNLNMAMARILQETMPTPQGAAYVTAFTNGNRFVCAGAVAQMQVALLLHRYRMESEARKWEAEAMQVPTDRTAALQRKLQTPPPSGEIRGRLVVDGKPLVGARVALFRNLTAETARGVVERAPLLLADDSIWNARLRYYMDLRSLRALYAVVAADDQGAFRFTPLDEGRYLLAVRLEGGTAGMLVQGGVGCPTLAGGQSVDVGLIHMSLQ